jgi:hypothetical protein
MRAALVFIAGWVALSLGVAAFDLIPTLVSVAMGVGVVIAATAGLIYLLPKLPALLGGDR